MRLGWLVNNFADPQLGLSKKQRERVQAETDSRFKGKLLVFTLLVVVPPPMLAITATGLADDWLGARLGVSRSLANLALVALVVVATWPYAAWAYGRFYARPIRRTLNEILDGVHVCERCGYDLDGLENPDRCPECGDAGRHRKTRPGRGGTSNDSTTRAVRSKADIPPKGRNDAIDIHDRDPDQ